jgi:hypothetical protein
MDAAFLGVLEVLEAGVPRDEVEVEKLNSLEVEALLLNGVKSDHHLLNRVEGSNTESLEPFLKRLGI